MRDGDRPAGLDLRLEFRHHRAVRGEHIAEPHRDQPHRAAVPAARGARSRRRAPGNTSRRTAWWRRAPKPARSPCRSRSSPCAAAPAATAASATLTEPNTLVLTPSPQSRSSSGTCLSAAAWNTMSGLKSANRRKMRSRSRTSAMRPSISALDALGAQRFQHRVQRGLGILDHQQPRGAERHHAVADFRADRAAAAGDDDRLAAHDASRAADSRSSRSAAAAGPRPRPARAAAPRRLRRATAAGWSCRPSRRARIRIDSGAASGTSADGVRISRAICVPRASLSRTTCSRSSRLPSTGMPRIDWPRSASDGDRMPTGRIRLTAPLSIARSSTSASAARPSTSVGTECSPRDMLLRARVAEIAVGDARARQEHHLQEPVEHDRDLAEEERAVDVRRRPGCSRAPAATAPAPSRRARC